MLKNILLAASALTIIAACGPKDETSSAETVLKNAQKAVPAVQIAKGNAANAEAALRILSLAEPGIAQFANKEVNGANASFENLSIAKFGDFGITAAKLKLDGLDVEGDTASFGRLIISDLSFDMGEADSGLSLGNIEIINPSPTLSAFISDITDNAKIDGELPDFLSLGFDKFKISDLAIDAPEGEFDGTISLASFGIDGNTPEKIGAIALKGLTVDGISEGDAISVRIGSVAIGGVLKSKLAEFVEMANSGSIDDMGFGGLMGNGDDLLEPGYDALSIADFAMNADGIAVSMPKLSMANTRNDSGNVTSTILAPMKLSVVPVGESASATQFKEAVSVLGLKKLDIIMGSVANIGQNQDTVSMDVGKNYIGIKDFATLKFGADYSGQKAMAKAFSKLEGDNFENNPDALLRAYAPLSFKSFNIQIENNGGIDTLLNFAAQQRGMELQAMIDEAKGMAAMVPMMAASQGIDAALASEVVNAALSFAENPKTLKFGFNPTNPLSVAIFSSEEAVMSLTKDTLGFSAVNE